MPYMVTTTYGMTAAAIDTGGPKGMELDQALSLACKRISVGEPQVAITDGRGNQISGSDLIACCRGEKRLTPDLRVVPN